LAVTPVVTRILDLWSSASVVKISPKTAKAANEGCYVAIFAKSFSPKGLRRS
jgi:hypothetical protein